MLVLRDYQQDGIAKIRASFAEKFRAPLYVLPTGGGKTKLFCAVAHGAAAKGNRVLIVSHRTELIDQISASLTEADTDHSFIASGYEHREATTHIASVGTIVKRLDKIKEPQLIIVDEAHHAVAATWRKILEYWPAARIFGVTATPIRKSGQGLGEIFDSLVLGPTTAELTTRGYLAPAQIYVPPTVDTSGLHVRMGDVIQAEAEALMNKPSITGDALAHYRKHADNLPAMAFCVSVQHAHDVAKQFREAGYPAYAIDGGTDKGIRRAAVADFRAGKILIMCSAEIFSEGFDLPGVHAGIMLRPTQSLGLHLQQVGRILRPAPGKSHAIIFDHPGNCRRFGPPDEPREWSLDGEVKNKKKGAPSVKVCVKCYTANYPTARHCSGCGAAFPIVSREIDHEDGDLVQLDATKIAAMREARQQRQVQGRAKTLAELQEIGRQKGYAPGWAAHVYEARQKKRRASST